VYGQHDENDIMVDPVFLKNVFQNTAPQDRSGFGSDRFGFLSMFSGRSFKNVIIWEIINVNILFLQKKYGKQVLPFHSIYNFPFKLVSHGLKLNCHRLTPRQRRAGR